MQLYTDVDLQDKYLFQIKIGLLWCLGVVVYAMAYFDVVLL